MDSLEEMFLGATGISSLPQVSYGPVANEAMLGNQQPQLTQAEQNYNTFLNSARSIFGDNPVILSALSGNAAVESAYSFDPAQKQIGGGGGEGVYQFDFHKPYYNKFLKDNNLKDTVDSQNQYVYENIYGSLQDVVGEGNAKAIREAFAGNDPQIANEVFMKRFLRPGKPHADRRAKETDLYFQKMPSLLGQ